MNGTHAHGLKHSQSAFLLERYSRRTGHLADCHCQAQLTHQEHRATNENENTGTSQSREAG